MTDLTAVIDDLVPSGPSCPECADEGVVFVARTPAGLGAHRYNKHGYTRVPNMGNVKGSSGRRVSQEEKAEFWRHINAGKSSATASALIGVSRQWGHGELRKNGWKPTPPKDVFDRKNKDADQQRLPRPLPYDELTPVAKDALADFGLFSEMFFARKVSPWRVDAANRVIEALLDRDKRTYFDINTPPGAGKSTLFTLDIPVWLICGGGFQDPARGRAIRIMLGSWRMKIAVQYVLRVRRILENLRAYYDKDQGRRAEFSIPMTYGRFKPLKAEGDESLWQQEQFLVAQIDEYDIVEKEPTVQAAARDSGFLGSRVDLYSWDDIATSQTARNADQAEELNLWFTDEAETRLEPGGVGLLVGQRLSSMDLHRKRLDATYIDDEGMERRIYEHIVYPAHSDETCDAQDGGDHRQWDLGSDGCLLDEFRLPWSDLVRQKDKPGWATVYQQRDSDPYDVLVRSVWLEGGVDEDGYDAPGCLNHQRKFLQWPKGVGRLVNYVVVDPAVNSGGGRGGYWAVEWWAVQAEAPYRRFLILGLRQKMQWGAFLDWDPVGNTHVGVMEDLQMLSCSAEHNQPILVWIVEQTSAFKGLFQFEHYRTWRRKWVNVQVIAHDTQRNKTDPERGVEALLPMLYKAGVKDLPAAREDLDALNFMRAFRRELTNYPHTETYDTVMADWMGEHNMPAILRLGDRFKDSGRQPKLNLPAYLERQRREVPLGAAS